MQEQPKPQTPQDLIEGARRQLIGSIIKDFGLTSGDPPAFHIVIENKEEQTATVTFQSQLQTQLAGPMITVRATTNFVMSRFRT